MRRHAKFGQNRSKRGGDIAIFRFFKMAAAAILDFSNFKFLMVVRVKRSNCVTRPNFAEIAQTAAEIFRFFDFSKMAAVRHLGFVMRVFGPPTKGIWWSLSNYHCAKFGWNRCSSFDNMHVFQFREFGLKTPINAPKIGVFGVYDPLNG